MASNKHRDNAAARTALFDVLADLGLHSLIGHYEKIDNPDIKEAMKIVVSIKQKLAAGTGGDDMPDTMLNIGKVAYHATKGLSELSDEDLFTMNMIDTAIMESFATIKTVSGVK